MLILTLFCFFTLMLAEEHSLSDTEKLGFLPPDQRVCLNMEEDQGLKK